MDQEEDLLNSLVAVATEELKKLDNIDGFKEDLSDTGSCLQNSDVVSNSNPKHKTSKKLLKETDIFQSETNLKIPIYKKSSSIIHSGDTDSSDDEGNRNYEDQKYNEYGREIKSLINDTCNSAIEANSISSTHYGIPKKRVSTWKSNPNKVTGCTSQGINISSACKTKPMFGKPPEIEKKFQDVFMDPIFGMRITNPLVSSSLLLERMQGRLAVKFSDLSSQIFTGNLKDKDWVICGVIVNKSPPKTSQKGSVYSIWSLSDLKDDIKTASLYMFGSSHSNLWKTAVGTVIGVLNPNIMERRDGSKDEASLSVDNAQKVMIFGQSKDFGICRSMKKNGEKCTAIVNLSRCEYCIYHIKQEYQKCSKRSELQANFAGRGLVNLRNKVLGKNEVFYAGKSYMAIPAKKSKKLEVKDNNIMQNLNGITIKSSTKPKTVSQKKKGVARHLDVNPAQRARDLKLLEKLGGASNLDTKTNFLGNRSNELSLEDSKSTALSVISKLKAKKNVEEQVNKKSQFNLKNDLFVNIESKNAFSGKVSENVTLEQSKNKVLTMIEKQKDKQKNITGNNSSENTEFNSEDLLSLEEIEGHLECEDLHYSDDDYLVSASEPVVSKSSTDLNGETNYQKDSDSTKKNEFSKKENAGKLSNDYKSQSNPKTPRDHLSVEKTPKHEKRKTESFGKISPKLSETDINPNNIRDSRKVLFSTPKTTEKGSKKSSDSGTPLKLDNFKQAPNNLEACPNKIDESAKSLVISSDTIKNNGQKSRFQPSLSLNNRPLMAPTQSVRTILKPGESNLDKTQSGLKSLSKEELNLDNMVMCIPMLSGFGKEDFIDLNKPVRPRHIDRAKVNAVKYIQRNGPIKKIDPNSTKSSGGKKRNIESVLGSSIDNNNVDKKNLHEEVPAKKSKLQESEFISDRFKKMMAMTSKYSYLLEQHDDEEKEKYFKKLEVKEQMEDKMANTHKVKCKAVRCLQCKYTSFSASELCKTERHPLKVFDAMKRFYKCSNCQNRTVTLELIPTRPCNNCGSSKWEKTGMMKEKIAVVQHNLSIRGGEQKFMNSVVADANLDLLVPDD